MECTTWRRPYKAGETFAYWLASDLHLDDPLCDLAMLRADLDRAKAEGARVLLNGDILGLILPGDLKRYARGADPGDVDDKIGKAVERAEEILAPYADIIDLIGTGNHETAVLKHHSVDATKLLIGFLNRRRSPKLPPIKHGGYTGFVRLSFDDGAKHQHSFDIFYNHGQGSGGEVTDGAIGLARREYIDADLVWLGHVHRVDSKHMAPRIGLDQYGKITERPRRGVITGTYLRNVVETDAGRDGYRLSYAEERMRRPQGRGGALLRLSVATAGVTARVET